MKPRQNKMLRNSVKLISSVTCSQILEWIFEVGGTFGFQLVKVWTVLTNYSLNFFPIMIELFVLG